MDKLSDLDFIKAKTKGQLTTSSKKHWLIGNYSDENLSKLKLATTKEVLQNYLSMKDAKLDKISIYKSIATALNDVWNSTSIPHINEKAIQSKLSRLISKFQKIDTLKFNHENL